MKSVSGGSHGNQRKGARGSNGQGSTKGASRHHVGKHMHIHTSGLGTHQAGCVGSYYVLGLVAQAHPVSLLLRKAVHPTRCHAQSGRAGWPQTHRAHGP